MSALKKLYNLVKTLNINDDNEEKCHGVSTDFITKLTDLKSATLTRLYGHVYLDLDEYPPYYDKNQSFLRHLLTEA